MSNPTKSQKICFRFSCSFPELGVTMFLLILLSVLCVGSLSLQSLMPINKGIKVFNSITGQKQYFVPLAENQPIVWYMYVAKKK